MIRGRAASKITVFALVLAAALASRAAIQITGLKSISQDEAREMIKDQVDLVKQSGGSRPLADDAAFFLEKKLQQRGFGEADVDWSFDEGNRAITLTVDEGPGLILGEIQVSGNVASVPEEDLKALVKRSTANRLRGNLLSGAKTLPFVESEIATGLADVAQLYQSLGYWDASTASLEDSVTRDGNLVEVNLQIRPGALHRFLGFHIGGDTSASSEEIQALLASLIGEPCTLDHVTEAQATVTHFFSERGYFHHKISMTPEHRGDYVTLKFQVDAGEPFTVSGLDISGNERVKDDFFHHRFKSLVGNPYSPEEADKIYRELLSIGLFSKISIRPEELNDAENHVDLAVSVEEANTRSLGVYGGYGNYDGGIIGLVFRENNVFGIGRQFRTTAEYTQRGIRGEAQYSDRWFYNSPFYWDARMFALTEQREGYEKFEAGIRSEIGREIGDYYSATAFATLSRTEILDAEIAAADLGEPIYRIGSIGLTHSYDRRDHPTLPSRGFVVDSTLEYAAEAFGSEVGFLRSTLRFSSYIPISDRMRLSLGARSGFIRAVGGDEQLPIDLRFFSGGSTSVRSFREKQLGPTDRQGYPLGGEFYTIFNAEYSVAIAGGLRAAAFADAGNLIGDLDNAGLDEMHYALGAGLRYDLPTGPIRLDYGWNMNRGKREPSGTFHISVGFAF